MEKETENWLASAEYDLQTAESLLEIGRHLHVVFFCHLVIEKTLKALISETTGSSPPRTHDLIKLSTLGQASLPPSEKAFVAELTDVSVATRYPVDLEMAYLLNNVG